MALRNARGLRNIASRRPVLGAVAEFDRIGRERFLEKYGFDTSEAYWLIYDGKRYDSKAIIGAAHGYARPDLGPLKHDQFSGGKATVQRKLERLGFTLEVSSDWGRLLISPDEADDQPFDPHNIEDARQRIVRSIAQRRGQTAFRAALMKAYGGRCAISGCSVPDVLEAAHIHPFRGPETNKVANGLLLRADLHTLFDCGLIAIDEMRFTVLVGPALRNSEYGKLRGVRLRKPTSTTHRPSEQALRKHRDEFGL
jgi:hypothetical protein